jgi:hypothetical protein
VQGLRGACESLVSRRRQRDGKFAALQRALSEPYFVVLPLAFMRCSIASRWLSQTASSSLAHKVAAILRLANARACALVCARDSEN